MTYSSNIFSFYSSIYLVLNIIKIGLLVFSIYMFFCCLRSDSSKFDPIFTKSGEYEKVIWIFLIIISSSIYGVGAIAYYFIIKKNK